MAARDFPNSSRAPPPAPATTTVATTPYSIRSNGPHSNNGVKHAPHTQTHPTAAQQQQQQQQNLIQHENSSNHRPVAPTTQPPSASLDLATLLSHLQQREQQQQQQQQQAPQQRQVQPQQTSTRESDVYETLVHVLGGGGQYNSKPSAAAAATPAAPQATRPVYEEHQRPQQGAAGSGGQQLSLEMFSLLFPSLTATNATRLNAEPVHNQQLFHPVSQSSGNSSSSSFPSSSPLSPELVKAICSLLVPSSENTNSQSIPNLATDVFSRCVGQSTTLTGVTDQQPSFDDRKQVAKREDRPATSSSGARQQGTTESDIPQISSTSSSSGASTDGASPSPSRSPPLPQNGGQQVSHREGSLNHQETRDSMITFLRDLLAQVQQASPTGQVPAEAAPAFKYSQQPQEQQRQQHQHSMESSLNKMLGSNVDRSSLILNAGSYPSRFSPPQENLVRTNYSSCSSTTSSQQQQQDLIRALLNITSSSSAASSRPSNSLAQQPAIIQSGATPADPQLELLSKLLSAYPGLCSQLGDTVPSEISVGRPATTSSTDASALQNCLRDLVAFSRPSGHSIPNQGSAAAAACHSSTDVAARTTTTEPYHGATNKPNHEPMLPPLEGRTKRRYTHEPFPQKLHRIVTALEAKGKDHIVSFLDGGGVWFHDRDIFVNEVLPKYFRCHCWSSFRRQLFSYSFPAVTQPRREKGAFTNPFFLRGRPELCSRIIRDDKHDKKKKRS
ncbi:hypothetical protein ACA910_002066 [Epithemia clementina (nom. ined.)]